MHFSKVSYDQYEKDMREDKYYTKSVIYNMDTILSSANFENAFKSLKEKDIKGIYDDIKLPTRATKKSAGYDIYAPYDFSLSPGESIKISTGIRVFLDDDKFLMCTPRSGHGFKSRLQLDNTIGIIDADYVESSNQGHIHIKLTNDSRTGNTLYVKKGEGLAQAIILQYFTVENDESSRQRDGGFGSTNN